MDSQTVQISPEVRSFLEGILADAGMTSLDEAMKEEMITELYARLDNFIASNIIENLPPEEVENFIKLNEQSKDRSEVERFIQEKVPNAKDVLAQMFSQFRDMYLSNVSVVRNAPDGNDQAANGQVAAQNGT